MTVLRWLFTSGYGGVSDGAPFFALFWHSTNHHVQCSSHITGHQRSLPAPEQKECQTLPYLIALSGHDGPICDSPTMNHIWQSNVYDVGLTSNLLTV
jgi:hypothetical protein